MEFITIQSTCLAIALLNCYVTARPWNFQPSRYPSSWDDEDYGVQSKVYANLYDNGLAGRAFANSRDKYADIGQQRYAPPHRFSRNQQNPEFDGAFINNDDNEQYMEEPKRENDVWNDLDINELYDAVAEWIEEKEEKEGNAMMKEKVMMQEPDYQVGDSGSNRAEDFETVLDKLFKISNENKMSNALNVHLRMAIKDLTLDNNKEVEEVNDQLIQEEDNKDDESHNIIVIKSDEGDSQSNSIGLTNGLTMDKAHALLEQLKEAEAKQTSAQHNYEQVDKQRIDALLTGGEKRSEEKVSTTPKLVVAERTTSTSQDFKTPSYDAALKLKTQLLQEENHMLIEALDSFSDLPLEYFQKAEDIQHLKMILEKAALRQNAVEYIDANIE